MPGPELQAAWHRLVGDVPGATAAGAYLLEVYAQPHRRYHDRRHLAEVLAHVDELRTYALDLDAVRLAAWFHDAVYQPTRSDNEESSAALADQLLPVLGVPAGRVAEVARLVRLTAGHDAGADDGNGAVLCDADLAVLGSASERYADYATGVRLEYAHVDAGDFAAARAAVLRGLLEREPLYRTASARDRWEERARGNIAAELRWLTGAEQGSPGRE
jgi:predicted metal-dependent HD superfamily phosphohydrolase